MADLQKKTTHSRITSLSLALACLLVIGIAAPSLQAKGRTLVVADREMLGVQIGMTFEQATKALATQNPSIPIDRTSFRNGRPLRMPVPGLSNSEYTPMQNYATVYVNPQTPQTRVAIHFSPPPMPSRVIRITRNTEFGSAGPTLENLLKSLVEKFGPSHFQSGCESKLTCSLSWQFASDGTPVSPQRIFGDVDSIVTGGYSGLGESSEAVYKFRKSGVSFVISVNTIMNGGLVEHLTMDMTDVKAALDANQKAEAAQKEEASRREGKARENAPKQPVKL